MNLEKRENTLKVRKIKTCRENLKGFAAEDNYDGFILSAEKRN